MFLPDGMVMIGAVIIGGIVVIGILLSPFVILHEWWSKRGLCVNVNCRSPRVDGERLCTFHLDMRRMREEESS